MNEAEIKQMIEQIGYQEFYRYFQEKTKLITNLQEENKKLKETIKVTKEKVIEIQEKYDYILEDIIFMLARGIDYER